MKFKRTAPILVSAALLLTAIGFNSALTKPKAEPQAAHASAKPVKQAGFTAAPDNMKGVWVTGMDLSMAYEADKSEKAFRGKFEAIAENCRSHGFDTLIVQVRPFCDALYESKLFPSSHELTGEQGADPGYDALKIMCDICRDKKLHIHAWVNPYRVTLNGVPDKLSGDNPSVLHSEYVLESETTRILDPSNEEARKLIADGVREIIRDYPVDGIQFDDYFYPPDIGDADSEQYESYCDSVQGTPMTLQKWRESNVDLLMAQVYSAVHETRQGAVFGISPQGNLQNNEAISADVVSWCTVRGYADYICPQLYFSLDNPALTFEDALADWTELDFSENVKLYAGLAGYKAGTDSDDGTWLDSDDILSREYNILSENQKVSGILLYGYASLCEKDAEAEISNLTKAMSESATEPAQASSPTQ